MYSGISNDDHEINIDVNGIWCGFPIRWKFSERLGGHLYQSLLARNASKYGLRSTAFLSIRGKQSTTIGPLNWYAPYVEANAFACWLHKFKFIFVRQMGLSSHLHWKLIRRKHESEHSMLLSSPYINFFELSQLFSSILIPFLHFHWCTIRATKTNPLSSLIHHLSLYFRFILFSMELFYFLISTTHES